MPVLREKSPLRLLQTASNVIAACRYITVA